MTVTKEYQESHQQTNPDAEMVDSTNQTTLIESMETECQTVQQQQVAVEC